MGNAGLLQSVAPVICNKLRRLYQLLIDKCPKAERFTSLLNEAKSKSTQDTLYILNEKTQFDALREHLLFTDVDFLDANVPISYFSKSVSVARKMTVNNCIIPGVWSPWQDANLIAIGASRITVLMYPYEVNLLKSRIREHNKECENIAGESIDRSTYHPILLLPSDQIEILNSIRDIVVEEEINHAQYPEWLNERREFAFDTLEIDDDDDVDDISEGILVSFDDDSNILVRPHSEIMLVTDDGVENVFASNLSPGDRIALLRGDVTRSIFNSVLNQVNHLIKVDNRVIDLWRSSIKKVLFEDSYEARPISGIIRSLRAVGCRRVDITIRQWFRGTTLAPQDIEDIRRVLELAGVPRASEISKIVSREIEEIRIFNRRLGRRISGQMKASITGETQPAGDRIDFEIDEVIEAVEYKNVIHIDIRDGVA